MKKNLAFIYLFSTIFIATLTIAFIFSMQSNEYSLHDGMLIINIMVAAAVIPYIYSKKYLIYFDAWFVLLFPFYYLISYVFAIHYDFTALGTSQETARKVLSLCFSTWIISIAILLLRPKAISPSLFFAKFEDGINFIKSKPTTFIIVFPLAFSVAIFFLRSVGELSFSNLLSQSRLEILHQVNEGGWYLKYFIIAYAWFSILYLIPLSPKKILIKLYIFIPIFVYVASLMLIGSRRELIFIILFFFSCIYIYSKGEFSKKQIILVVGLLTGMLFLGMLRSRDEHTLEIYINALGEFLFPISTLYYYIENDNPVFLPGSSYLQFFYNFIPKAIFPEKPVSLAVEFAHLVAPSNADYIMGYAFTPITEAYLNFGLSCFLILPAMIATIAFFVELASRRHPMITVVFLSQVLNFQRGELSSFFFEIILLITSLFTCFILSRGRLK